MNVYVLQYISCLLRMRGRTATETRSQQAPLGQNLHYLLSLSLRYYSIGIPNTPVLVICLGHSFLFVANYITVRGPGSSVGIATDYGLDGLGIEPRWDEIFRPSRPAHGAHPASCTMGTGSFPGVKYGRDVLLNTHPLLVPRSWKSRAIPLPTLWATTGPATGPLYLYITVQNSSM